MKKTKILKLACTVLAALTVMLPVCTAVNLPDMIDPIESVVRLGKFSSKIDPTIPFDEGCVVVYLSKPASETSPYNKLTVKDLPFLELESVEYVPTHTDYRAPDIYLLNLKNPGRREVAEAIVALENNYENIAAMDNLIVNMVVPCPAISPKYDYLDVGGKFTRNEYKTRYDFICPEFDINEFSVEFSKEPDVPLSEFPEIVFPEITAEIDKVAKYGNNYYTVYLKSMEEVLPYHETMEEQLMRVYKAVAALNHRAEDDIKKIHFPNFEFNEGQLPYSECNVYDYTREDWFASAVNYVINWNLMQPEVFSIKGPVTIKNTWNGEEVVYVESDDLKIYQHNFYPEMGMTRAMLVTVLFRISNYPYVNAGNVFSDVPDDQWYSEAVKWAYENDIIEGVGDEKFAPDREITREEFVTIMYRYHTEWNDSPVRYRTDFTGFSDSSAVSDWAHEGMAWAVGNHLIEGRDGNLIASSATITRAEAAKIIMRYDDYTPKA
ncbi:MAG: S-layer homology domain-containing protein [Clostridia bacterium]|nr:S-layer homology domain-containing protein [Clostridia bacterium]